VKEKERKLRVEQAGGCVASHILGAAKKHKCRFIEVKIRNMSEDVHSSSAMKQSAGLFHR
jgi:hypothetical protein